MKKTYKIDVDCANCANKMEEAARKTEGVQSATVISRTERLRSEVNLMNKKQKIMLIRILTAAALLAVLHVLPVTGWMRFGLYLIPYLIAGYDILRKALKGIQNRQVFDENFLMAVATVGAIALALYERSGDYTEAIAVMLFYQIG